MIFTKERATTMPNVLNKTSRNSPLRVVVIIICNNSIKIPNKKAVINEKM